MSKNMPFDDIAVGEELGPVETRITEKAIQGYIEDWDDPNPAYTSASSLGPPVMPPAFMAGLTCFRLLGSKYNASTTVGTKSEHELFSPAWVGGTLISTGRIAAKYIRRGLEYVVVESTTVDEHGRLIRKSVDHIMLGLERYDREDSHEP
jgi:hypothetical protein